jgi:hypothetical protein
MTSDAMTVTPGQMPKQMPNLIARLFLMLAAICGARFTIGDSCAHFSLPESWPPKKGWRAELIDCQTAEAERQRLGLTAYKLGLDLTTSQTDVEELRRLMSGSIRLIHNAGPMLQNLLGTLIYGGPNVAFTEVSWSNEHVMVRLDPFNELIVVSGLGSNVPPLELHVPGGGLSDTQQELLLGRLKRYQATQSGASDPVAAQLSLAGAVISGEGGA